MSCKNIKLGDIPIIANSLKCGTTRAVKTLNSILGFTEFDRSSRNKIRNFSTFPKEFRVEEHKEKILTEFSLPDFISVANLLHLDVERNEQNLCNSIFKALTNLDEFQLTLNNSEASFSEGENVVSKTTFQKRITLDRNFSSEGTDQHSSFQQHPVSNAPLPSVQERSRKISISAERRGRADRKTNQDNAPCHRTVAAEQLLESRRLAARILPPVTIWELRLALQDEWAAMPQQLIDTLILSMGRCCETCLAVRGDHIPY
ncbi:uncharacterized protein LOC105457711 [Trichonephila clavipes]|nr:uncharacterized protein LOC105457711 [Trichonephila clavipes]